jgi:hypothetical protein
MTILEWESGVKKYELIVLLIQLDDWDSVNSVSDTTCFYCNCHRGWCSGCGRCPLIQFIGECSPTTKGNEFFGLYSAIKREDKTAALKHARVILKAIKATKPEVTK